MPRASTQDDTLPVIEGQAEKQKALEIARLQIEKQFGTGAIIRLGDNPDFMKFGVVPSGSILLDEALGIGGYPRGRIIEIFGPESSGKTTLALHAVAEAQKLGGVAAFIDVEHALDPTYAKNLGVDINALWVSQPEAGEQALEITEELVRSGALDIIVIDSVAALTPRAEIEGEMGDSHMGLQARLMSQALRKLTSVVSKSHCIVIFINQIRMKIGVMFGNPETTTGGNALKFYASMRIDVRRAETIDSKTGDAAQGHKMRVKVVKNKVAPPFRKVELDIYFGKGISAAASVLDSGVLHEVIEKKGAWYYYKGSQLACGKDNAVKYLEDNKEIREEIEHTLRELIFPNQKIQKVEAKAEAKKDIPATMTEGTKNIKSKPAAKAVGVPSSTADLALSAAGA